MQLTHMSELDIEGLFYATTPLYLHNTKLHQNVIKQPKEKNRMYIRIYSPITSIIRPYKATAGRGKL